MTNPTRNQRAREPIDVTHPDKPPWAKKTVEKGREWMWRGKSRALSTNGLINNILLEIVRLFERGLSKKF